MSFGKGIGIGAGIGGGGLLLVIIIMSYTPYNDYQTEQNTQNQKLLVPTSQSDDAKRREIELLAQTNPLVKGLINGKLRFYIEPVPSYASLDVSGTISEVTKSLRDTLWAK